MITSLLTSALVLISATSNNMAADVVQQATTEVLCTTEYTLQVQTEEAGIKYSKSTNSSNEQKGCKNPDDKGNKKSISKPIEEEEYYNTETKRWESPTDENQPNNISSDELYDWEIEHGHITEAKEQYCPDCDVWAKHGYCPICKKEWTEAWGY